MGDGADTTAGSDVGRGTGQGTAAALATQFGFALAVVAFAALGFLAPGLFTWRWQGFEPRQAIVPLVQITMLGMGLTLTAADFRRVLATPAVVALGAAAQFGIMPLAGWAFTRLFGLTGEVAAGLILVGSCPGGVASAGTAVKPLGALMLPGWIRAGRRGWCESDGERAWSCRPQSGSLRATRPA